MKLSLIAARVSALLSCLGMLWAQTSFPRMTTVDPMTAKVGDVVTAGLARTSIRTMSRNST